MLVILCDHSVYVYWKLNQILHLKIYDNCRGSAEEVIAYLKKNPEYLPKYLTTGAVQLLSDKHPDMFADSEFIQFTAVLLFNHCTYIFCLIVIWKYLLNTFDTMTSPIYKLSCAQRCAEYWIYAIRLN